MTNVDGPVGDPLVGRLLREMCLLDSMMLGGDFASSVGSRRTWERAQVVDDESRGGRLSGQDEIEGG